MPWKFKEKEFNPSTSVFFAKYTCWKDLGVVDNDQVTRAEIVCNICELPVLQGVVNFVDDKEAALVTFVGRVLGNVFLGQVIVIITQLVRLVWHDVDWDKE